MHNIIISCASREASRSGSYSFERMYAATKLALLTSDQLTIEVIVQLALEKLLTLYNNNMYPPSQYHAYIYQFLKMIRESDLPSSGIRELMLNVLRFSSKVMVVQADVQTEYSVMTANPDARSIQQALSYSIGEASTHEVKRILDMFYIG